MEHVCRAVDLACIWYPKEVRCLQRSAATACLLKHCGFPAQMVVGARWMPFQAHAWDGTTHDLTEKEAMILKVLAEHPGEVVTRDDLLEKVWGYEVYPSTRTVDNHILKLRQKLERDPSSPVHFRTVHGMGYKFVR